MAPPEGIEPSCTFDKSSSYSACQHSHARIVVATHVAWSAVVVQQSSTKLRYGGCY